MRFALSPLQWLATEDGWIDFTGGPPLPDLCKEVRAIGFDAISAGITPDVDVDAYREAIPRSHGCEVLAGLSELPPRP